MAWGRPYADTLVSLALPAILAPGNLPSLAAMMDCDLVIVTEQAFFAEIRDSVAFRRVQQCCPVRLFPIDDLIVAKGRYGMTLTFAFHRGFADLGEAMTDHHLIFFNADFILADGSFRTLGHRILAGERLIHAPSYCTIQEEAEPLLRRLIDRDTQTLALSSRDMAEMILAHRHYTIRGKTVNQRVFHSEIIEQFYSQVDEHTLLGRQMPSALVCMKPERVVEKMRTFWDYGVVSEFCPNMKPCVLGDSDDFCMLELRRAQTMLQQMALGWPTPEEIAHTLGRFVTQDQKDMGRYPLVLHSRALPATVQIEQDRLSEFVESVYRHMPEKAVPHLNHPFWVHHYGPFQAERTKYVAGDAPAPGITPEAPARPKPSRFDHLLRRLRLRLFGTRPLVGPLHPLHSVLKPTYDLVEQDLARPGRRILLIADHDGPVSGFVRLQTERGHRLSDGAGVLHPDPGKEAAIADLSRQAPFDLLVCELTFASLLKFRHIFDAVASLLARPARVIVFHFNPSGESVHLNSCDVVQHVVVPVGHSTIMFAGSTVARAAFVVLKWATKMRRRHRWLGEPLYLGLVAGSVTLAAAAGVWPKRVTTDAPPRTCLAMTIDYELLP